MPTITGKTKLVGVMGWPIDHSLSPPMQNAAIEALGLDWVYIAMPVAPERLGEAVAGARAMGFVGFNVTIPHKETVMPFLDEVHPSARAIGAVNTVHITDHGMIGGNTDADGYVRTVTSEGTFRFHGKTVLQVGAGGVGRAMASGAAHAGAVRVILHDIMVDRAEELAHTMAKHYPGVTFEALVNAEDLVSVAAEADLIANATPLGMKPDDPSVIPPEAIEERHTVFDAVYHPAQTPLLEAARNSGAKAVPGLGMLARQGARSLQIWSGRQPDEGLMIETLRRRLGLNSQ